jgi:hypothetical protein
LMGLIVRDADQPRILGKAVQGQRDRNGEFLVDVTLEFS